MIPISTKKHMTQVNVFSTYKVATPLIKTTMAFLKKIKVKYEHPQPTSYLMVRCWVIFL